MIWQKMKPKVFIGSSREGIRIADAIHFNLTHEAECTVWKDDIFRLSSNTLSALIDALRMVDFAVFVFSPDDITTMRERTSGTVRDNVVFELGLFIGRLWQERCFFLVPDGVVDLSLPSDLAGVTAGRYESNRSDGNWFAALNPSCMQIKMQMARLKSFQDATSSNNMHNPIKESKSVSIDCRVDEEKVFAEYYKRGIICIIHDKIDVAKIQTIGSWNQKLQGWIVPRVREKELREIFPGISIKPSRISD